MIVRHKLVCLPVLLTALYAIPNLSAGLCINTTDCTLTFDIKNNSAGFGALSSYGTVELTLTPTNDIQFLISLADGFTLGPNSGGIGPGAFAFNENPYAHSTFGYSDFTSGYSGGSDVWDTNGFCDSVGEHYDGFGCFEHSAATSTPDAANALSIVSFVVNNGGNFTDVNQLLNPANPGGSDATPVYLTADVRQSATGFTGLIGVDRVGAHIQAVPEPASLGVLLAGLGAIAIVIQIREYRRKNPAFANSKPNFQQG